MGTTNDAGHEAGTDAHPAIAAERERDLEKLEFRDVASPAQKWRDPATAPDDGTMVRLLVQFTEHSTADSSKPAVTIGVQVFDPEIRWHFAGWSWTNDHFTDGEGTVIGWLPLVDEVIMKGHDDAAGAAISKFMSENCALDWFDSRNVDALVEVIKASQGAVQ